MSCVFAIFHAVKVKTYGEIIFIRVRCQITWWPSLLSRWRIRLCSHKFHKIEHYFSFEVLKKKIWANFQRIIELFTQKIVSKLSKIWVWDPGSEIRDPGSGKNLFRIPDPGVKKAPDPGSGSATLLLSIGSLDEFSIPFGSLFQLLYDFRAW
jgi:hypothetical protein